jgi:hypothetical protein
MYRHCKNENEVVLLTGTRKLNTMGKYLVNVIKEKLRGSLVR